MIDVDLAAITEGLYKRRESGVLVPYESPDGLSWKPHRNFCHINADRLALENQGLLKSVRGWLVLNYCDVGRFRFMSHSVNRGADGRLFDITPGPRRPAFIEHNGPMGEFEAIVEAGYRWLDHQIRP
jgi:hypothetical protein